MLITRTNGEPTQAQRQQVERLFDEARLAFDGLDSAMAATGLRVHILTPAERLAGNPPAAYDDGQRVLYVDPDEVTPTFIHELGRWPGVFPTAFYLLALPPQVMPTVICFAVSTMRLCTASLRRSARQASADRLPLRAGRARRWRLAHGPLCQ